MSEALTLPEELTDEERALLEAFIRPVEERAALAIRVRREVLRLAAQGHAIGTAFEVVDEDPRYPVSSATARDIWYRRGAWAAD